MSYIRIIAVASDSIGESLIQRGLREGFVYREQLYGNGRALLTSLNGGFKLELSATDTDAIVTELVTDEFAQELAESLASSNKRKAALQERIENFWMLIYAQSLDMNKADVAVDDFIARLNDGDFRV